MKLSEFIEKHPIITLLLVGSLGDLVRDVVRALVRRK